MTVLVKFSIMKDRLLAVKLMVSVPCKMINASKASHIDILTLVVLLYHG